MNFREAFRRRSVQLAALYGLLLLASHAVRWSQATPAMPGDYGVTTLPAFERTGAVDGSRDVAWLTWRDGQAVSASSQPAVRDWADTTPVILLHGSPGSASNFRAIGPGLSESRPVLAPDLPGFGFSDRRVPSYSIEAHAHAVLAWMDRVGIDAAHLVGFSMGGGVALHIWDQQPDRVRSISMLAAIGVQEFELLGDYHLNHLLHGVQLVGLETLRFATPHFGVLDGMLDYSYERNFYDTDQRPLRALLERFQPPMLILHGERDPLVPKEAAIEHARIVPQAELVLRPDSHFFVFRPDSGAQQTIDEFLARVDRGAAATRNLADAGRLVESARPFDRASLPDWSGPALLVVLLLIAAATLVSEDLTLIGTGLLVAQGRIDYLPAAGAAFIGIVSGDMLLFWAGRALGRRVVRKRPFSWWISPQAIRESSRWLRRRGAIVVLITRVLPGARLPTNVAAGLLRTSAIRFLIYFTAAGVFWTFPVVWLCTRLGEQILPQLEQWRWRLLAGLVVLGGVMWVVRKFLVPLVTWRGRRRLLGAWRYRSRWEFWPAWMIYGPLIPYFLWLGLKHRGLTVFSAVNPGIQSGGVVGESKASILRELAQDAVPSWIEIPAESPEYPAPKRLETLQAFFREQDLQWPLVVKPDVGERGSGVLIARSWDEVGGLLEQNPKALIGQRHVDGQEYSAFWIKRPHAEHGDVYSVTVKRRPTVTGDGRRSLYDLILEDERAVALASTYLNENPNAKETVPERGEVVALSEVGAHSRGTIFEEGAHLITETLGRELDRIALASSDSGDPSSSRFDFGRFDIITESDDSFRQGRDLWVIELNGVTSESSNMYDARYGLRDAWRILRDQWRICYEIGAERRALGRRPDSLVGLLRVWLHARSA